MCTATWWFGAQGYELFFNRDELRARPAGEDPQVFDEDGIQYLAPTDPVGGGTWLAVNQFGLSVGLLNQYPLVAFPEGVSPISRGLLIRRLALEPDAESIRLVLAATDLSAYQPFLLFVVEPGASVSKWLWDGVILKETSDLEWPVVLTSSSYASEEVVSAREHYFAEAVVGKNAASPEGLRAFHQSHWPESGAHSVFMSRPDAETVSFAHIVVTADSVKMEYAAKVPDALRLEESVQAEIPLQPVEAAVV